MEVCHRLEMQPFDVSWGGDLGANTNKHAHTHILTLANYRLPDV